MIPTQFVLAVAALVEGLATSAAFTPPSCADSTLGLREVTYSPEQAHVYLGSPSLLRLRTGDLIATADRFGTGHHPPDTSVHHSSTNGTTWQLHTWVQRTHFSNLFESKGFIYLLGTDCTDRSLCAVKISRSVDGLSWPASQQAIILNGSNYATGPTPTLAANGRLYRAMEVFREPRRWGVDFAAAMLHADVDGACDHRLLCVFCLCGQTTLTGAAVDWAHDIGCPSCAADLLDPASWSVTPAVPFDTAWLPYSWGSLPTPGYLEGNAALGPDGTSVYCVLRLNSKPQLGNYAVKMRLNETSNTLAFDRLVELPGGHSKFVIHRDPESGFYFTLSNVNENLQYTDQRNVLVLAASADLDNLTILRTLLHDDTGLRGLDSARYTGARDLSIPGPITVVI
eukprot:SAG25_NODE_1222_length_3569_cov_3.378963_4_plen_398_part_00